MRSNAASRRSSRQRDNLVAAVEAGKQAYREAVSTTPNDSAKASSSAGKG